MIPAALRERLRSGRARVVAAIVVAALGALVVVLAVAGSADGVKVSSRFVAGTPEAGEPVRLDTSLYLPASTPAPARPRPVAPPPGLATAPRRAAVPRLRRRQVGRRRQGPHARRRRVRRPHL